MASKHFFCTISSRANPCAVPHATKPHSLCRFREVQDAGGENCMTTVGWKVKKKQIKIRYTNLEWLNGTQQKMHNL